MEQANKALADVTQELDKDALDQVAGAGDPFENIPRPDSQPITPVVRRNG